MIQGCYLEVLWSAFNSLEPERDRQCKVPWSVSIPIPLSLSGRLHVLWESHQLLGAK